MLLGHVFDYDHTHFLLAHIDASFEFDLIAVPGYPDL